MDATKKAKRKNDIKISKPILSESAFGQARLFTHVFERFTYENSKVLDKAFVYEYNDSGGIRKVEEYAYTEGTLSGTPATT